MDKHNNANIRQELIKEFKDLEKDIQNPEIIHSQELFRQKTRRHAQLTSIIEKINLLNEATIQLNEANQLLETESEQDMLELYQEEIQTLENKEDRLKKEINALLKTSDPNDTRNAIIEIRAGTGGEEAALFAADLFRMYSLFCEKNGWKLTILSANYTNNGGFKEIIARIEGDGVYGKLKYESGVHRVQRIPTTESSGRIHTSAASVVVLPEVDDIPEISIQENEIKVDVYRSTGPGGQSVNTTDSAVRITHLPTGIVVTCQDNKSQHKNKERALSVLKSKLYQIKQQEISEKTDDTRKKAIQSGDRSAKIRTYNFPQSRVTDHRIKQSWHNLINILNGDIDEICRELSNNLSDENVT